MPRAEKIPVLGQVAMPPVAAATVSEDCVKGITTLPVVSVVAAGKVEKLPKLLVDGRLTSGGVF
jgi:hypothetical protein